MKIKNNLGYFNNKAIYFHFIKHSSLILSSNQFKHLITHANDSGVPLEECPMCTEPSQDHVPLLVQVCCSVVENRGLGSVGIYRVPGNSAAVVALTEQVCVETFHVLVLVPVERDVALTVHMYVFCD